LEIVPTVEAGRLGSADSTGEPAGGALFCASCTCPAFDGAVDTGALPVGVVDVGEPAELDDGAPFLGRIPCAVRQRRLRPWRFAASAQAALPARCLGAPAASPGPVRGSETRAATRSAETAARARIGMHLAGRIAHWSSTESPEPSSSSDESCTHLVLDKYEFLCQ
jgi:hypothetical protein